MKYLKKIKLLLEEEGFKTMEEAIIAYKKLKEDVERLQKEKENLQETLYNYIEF